MHTSTGMTTALVGLLSALIGAVSGLAGARRRLEPTRETRWNGIASSSSPNVSGRACVAAGQLAAMTSRAIQTIDWFVWRAAASAVGFTAATIDEYDEEIKQQFPLLMEAIARVAASAPGVRQFGRFSEGCSRSIVTSRTRRPTSRLTRPAHSHGLPRTRIARTDSSGSSRPHSPSGRLTRAPRCRHRVFPQGPDDRIRQGLRRVARSRNATLRAGRGPSLADGTRCPRCGVDLLRFCAKAFSLSGSRRVGHRPPYLNESRSRHSPCATLTTLNPTSSPPAALKGASFEGGVADW